MKKYCPRCGTLLKIMFEEWSNCAKCNWTGLPADAMPEPRLAVCPAMRQYLSIDIETTGLDPDTCQILEIGAVLDDWQRPVDRLPVYHRLVVHPQYRGDAYALALNSKLLKRLAGPQDSDFRAPDQIADDFRRWLQLQGWDGDKSLTPAGKNFASFDKQFLKRLPGFERAVPLSHRTIDPAILFWNPATDDKLPDSKTCYERAGLDGKVAHTAVEDALAVVKLIRFSINRLVEQ